MMPDERVLKLFDLVAGEPVWIATFGFIMLFLAIALRWRV